LTLFTHSAECICMSIHEMPTGGCESIAQKGIAAVVLLAAILVVWYVVTFMHDNVRAEMMCGGGDQRCCCAGNETFVERYGYARQ
jgi:hypothetical protein